MKHFTQTMPHIILEKSSYTAGPILKYLRKSLKSKAKKSLKKTASKSVHLLLRCHRQTHTHTHTDIDVKLVTPLILRRGLKIGLQRKKLPASNKADQLSNNVLMSVFYDSKVLELRNTFTKICGNLWE